MKSSTSGNHTAHQTTLMWPCRHGERFQSMTQWRNKRWAKSSHLATPGLIMACVSPGRSPRCAVKLLLNNGHFFCHDLIVCPSGNWTDQRWTGTVTRINQNDPITRASKYRTDLSMMSTVRHQYWSSFLLSQSNNVRTVTDWSSWDFHLIKL